MTFINFLEAFIFTYFIASYFELSKKYFYITAIVHFLVLMFFSAINNEGVILSIVIVILMIVSIILETRQISFRYFYVVIIYESVLLCVNYFGILALYIFDFFHFDRSISIIILNILVKILLFAVTFIILKYKRNMYLSLDIKKWSLVIIFETILLSAIAMLSYELFMKEYSLYMSLILLVLMDLLSILFIIIVYRIHLMNMNVLETTKLQQLKEFNEEKLNTITHIKNNIDSLEHRMIYVLLKIKYSIEKNELTEANDLIDEYIYVISKNKLILNTGNAIFDSILGLKVNELKQTGLNINISVLISNDLFYDDLSFINIIIQLLDQFSSVKYLNLIIEEVDDNVKVRILYKDGEMNISEIEKMLNNLKKVDYNVTNYEDEGIRLLFRKCNDD